MNIGPQRPLPSPNCWDEVGKGPRSSASAGHIGKCSMKGSSSGPRTCNGRRRRRVDNLKQHAWTGTRPPYKPRQSSCRSCPIWPTQVDAILLWHPQRTLSRSNTSKIVPHPFKTRNEEKGWGHSGTLPKGTKSKLTLDNLSFLTRKMFIEAGGLDKPTTLRFVEVTTLDIRQPFSPKGWTQSLGGLCTIWGP